MKTSKEVNRNQLYLFILLIGFAFLMQNCQKDDSTILEESQIPTELSSKNGIKIKIKIPNEKLTVCRYNNRTGTWDAVEINMNSTTNEGDVIIDEDRDGYAVFNECGLLNDNGIDCDDKNSAVRPNVEEICGDGKDNDCNGQIDDCA